MMDEELERQMRGVLASQQFGVLATLYGGRLHTATVHYAETPQLALVYAIKPASLKAQLIAGNAHAAFQVDNRDAVPSSPERFIRISIEGDVRAVPPDDTSHESFARVYREKLPVGAAILESAEVALYVLRPNLIRVAVGAAPAEDIAISYDDPLATTGDAAGAGASPWTRNAREPSERAD